MDYEPATSPPRPAALFRGSAREGAELRLVQMSRRTGTKHAVEGKAASPASGSDRKRSLPDAEADLLRAGKALHDDVAPLLAAAGLRLQLLRMDHPQTAERVTEVMVTLDDAMERIRTLSQELSPPPVYRVPEAAPRLRPRRGASS
jgi:signal transduction histidine kinase